MTTCEACGRTRHLIPGERYQWFWPCGCSVRYEVYEHRPVTAGEERRFSCSESRGVGPRSWHPTREGAIKAWRDAIPPYEPPSQMAYGKWRLSVDTRADGHGVFVLPPVCLDPAAVAEQVRRVLGEPAPLAFKVGDLVRLREPTGVVTSRLSGVVRANRDRFDQIPIQYGDGTRASRIAVELELREPDVFRVGDYVRAAASGSVGLITDTSGTKVTIDTGVGYLYAVPTTQLAHV